MHDIQRVLMLDTGDTPPETFGRACMKIPREQIDSVTREMAIVIPIKNDEVKILEGVFSGIPQNCLTIIVSNSTIEKIDRFNIEVDALTHFHHFTRTPGIIVHQKNPYVGQALKKIGYKKILDRSGIVRDGKAEGMILGILLAKLFNKKFVGFVDSDNYIPGAVLEYVRNYAAGFSMVDSPYLMVRNSWGYKPKIRESEIFFKRRGRVTVESNKYLNAIISHITKFDTQVIRTGCAGEHAMNMALAELMPMASNFAVETYEILFLLEEFGGVIPHKHKETMGKQIDLFQIETRNPHFHTERGGVHLKDMFRNVLSAIYHNALCSKEMREEICKDLVAMKVIKAGTEPPTPLIYPPINSIDFKAFTKEVKCAFEEEKGADAIRLFGINKI
jgi:mannosyl-3-phosphoglycerate synthase